MQEDFLPHDVWNELVEAAVKRIVGTGDLDGFLAWFSDEVNRQRLLARLPLEAGKTKALAVQLGRSLWGATPAPHNGFRPQPLPKPSRNAPCFCGSGLKYKHCCARFSTLPAISSDDLWPAVLDALPQRDCRQLVAVGRAPVESLIDAAHESKFLGDTRKAIGFLEPMFASTLAGTGHQYGRALSLLCDLYGDAGWSRKKAELIERIVAEAPRSELRSLAFQRMAILCIERGDRDGAWEAFRQAQRDTPGDPLIALLEIHLLMAEHQPERARESARVWRKRLGKRNAEENDRVIAFLTAAAQDPHRAMAATFNEATGGAGQRLLEALPNIVKRPLPRYEVAAVPALDPSGELGAGIARQLRGMGIAEEDVREFAPELLEQARSLAHGDGSPDEVSDATSDAHLTLQAPERLRVLEADWHAIYSPGKPFSINEVPRQAEFPWDPNEEDAWMGFLDRHPEAFDSIDVLDDLATAVELHPMRSSAGFREAMQVPLVERGVRILEQAFGEAGPSGNLYLEWADARNRPVLRCLARAQFQAMEQEHVERAQYLAERLIALNPSDSHGMRTSLMNIYLRAGDDEGAVLLASSYEDDMFPELPYGRVLALVRLGRMDEASEAAQLAVNRLPEVRRHLMRERARQPRIDPYGVALGSKEQAWLYRDEMRDLWVGEPEAMALLRHTRPSTGTDDG
ncbi:MAG: SEC-C domain-containing protein [Gammaproteobacteria bacterium]|nr:SEC-C domain-containing protein [Gammaproteobacteria bacterium]MDE0273025.1 SEC-C domain-containing protein [Gammaproteobacteria bacterium]